MRFDPTGALDLGAPQERFIDEGSQGFTRANAERMAALDAAIAVQRRSDASGTAVPVREGRLNRHRKIKPSRHRTIDVTIWDRKWLRESSRNAQLLCLYLVTGPHTSCIPGLCKVGKAQLLDGLRGWTQEELDDALRELIERDVIRYDEENRVLWVPWRIEEDGPDSPKTVIGWQTVWAEIPDCALKRAAWELFSRYMPERDQRENAKMLFAEAFRESCQPPGRE